jgi:repressor LexA
MSDMSIGERVKLRREQLGLTADQLADRLGKHRATIYRYESNEIENLPLSVLEPLARALGVSPAYLMGWEAPAEAKCARVLVAVKGVSPVFGRDTFQYYAEEGDSMDVDFCLRVRDGNMVDPDDTNGDLVFVKQQSSVDTVDVAVVALDSQVVLGHLYEADKGIILEPLNRDRRPMFAKQFLVLGRAVLIQTKL